MTEKKNKEVSRDSTRYPAGQANAENSQGAEIVRLLLLPVSAVYRRATMAAMMALNVLFQKRLRGARDNLL